MKLLSYNFMSGGFGSYSYELLQPERLDGLIKALGEEKFDLVTLVDTFRWKELFTLVELKEIFGYRFAYSIELEDEKLRQNNFDTGITVLTNLDVKHFETIRLGTRNGIKTTIEENGKEMDIYSIYLDYEDEYRRLEQIENLLNIVNRKRPVVIMGDFNTIDHGDVQATEQGIIEAVLKLPMFDEVENQINGMKKGLVTEYIKSKGFVDADQKRNFTAPTPLSKFFLFRPVIRIDYIFVNKKIQINSFEVLKGGRWDKLSDHYPITAEIETKTTKHKESM